jgi:DNA-directed RNA polymerase subunit RPC12/RpoP
VLDDVENANNYEHECIIFMCEIFGKKNVLNKMPGGGNHASNMNVKTELYLILYNSKALAQKDIDFTLSSRPPSSFYHSDLTPLPKLDLPLFHDRFTHMPSVLRKLGYVVARSEKESVINGKFQCGICDDSFNSYVTCSRHKKNEHSQAHCHMCGEGFASTFTLVDHLKEMHDIIIKKEYKCLHCSATFDNTDARKLHQIRHKEKCEHCGKMYVHSTIYEHIRYDHPAIYKANMDAKAEAANARPFVCTYNGCPKPYSFYAGLFGHLKDKHLELYAQKKQKRVHKCTVEGFLISKK